MTYYLKNPTTPERKLIINTRLKGHELVFETSSSVFAAKKIDKGTMLLANESCITPNTKILDLGCGYGTVGIAIKKSLPSASVTLSDINERAVRLAKQNAKTNKTEVSVIASDGFENIKETFDTILLNPPQTAGKKTCKKLIIEAKQHLSDQGTLQVVARHQKGGRSYEKIMKETYGNVKTTARQSGYRIYSSQKTL